MKRGRKRYGTPADIYGKLSRSTVWISFTFLSLISYIAEVRPLVSSSLGNYATGLLDGVLVTSLIVAIIFYFLSRIAK